MPFLIAHPLTLKCLKNVLCFFSLNKKLFVYTSSFPIYLLIAFFHFTPDSFTQTSFCAIVFVSWGNGGSLLRKKLRRHAIERFVRRGVAW